MATSNQSGRPISSLPLAGSVSPTDALLGVITKSGSAEASQITIIVLAQAISSAIGLDEAVAAAQKAAESAGSSASDTLIAARGRANGVAALSADKRLILGDIEVFGLSQDGHLLVVADLPTSDPGVAGAFWNNGQYVMISAG